MKIFILFNLLLLSCTHVKNWYTLENKEKKQIEISTTPKIPVPVIEKKIKLSSHVKKYCDEIDKTFKKYQWQISKCHQQEWHHVRNSKLGRPLIWSIFSDDEKSTNNVTMILCAVHGDEITPAKFCFDIINSLNTNPLELKNHTLIVAPIVTPDSFFKKKPTRTNANKVDVNRNFPTKDWNKKALSTWKNRYGSDPRRFPGLKSLSEAETIFQVNLIKRYQPHKIISVHAPLTLLDYDGPRITGNKLALSPGEKLLKTMSQKARHYKIKDYPFFPGSLGNYAGNERQIPTYTLELPNSDPRRSKEFWNTFKEAIRSAIITDFRHVELEKPLPELEELK